MAQVRLTINGRSYEVGCDDGQEEHLARLAAFIDRRVGELAATVGQVGEARLLVMASLLIADELHDCRREAAGSAAKTARDHASEATAAKAIEGAVSHIDALARRLGAP